MSDGRRLVIRLLTNESWLSHEPDLARHESAVLECADRTQLPAPRVVAIDEAGIVVGVPAVLMSHVPGSVVLPRRPSERWIDQLAAALASIHRHRAPSLRYDYRSWTASRALTVPSWSQRPDLWQRALHIRNQGPPRAASVLPHRDYHPANVLWRRGRISAIVDWINGCRGPRGVDVAHCRKNLALMYGVDVATRFLYAYARAAGGYRHHAYWDIDDLFDGMPGPTYYRPWRTFGLPRIRVAVLRARAEALLDSADDLFAGKPAPT